MPASQNVINFKDTIANNTETLKSMGSSLQTISNIITKTCYYISHPLMVLKNMWIFTVDNSFSVCLVLTMLGVTLYLIGIKKGSKIAKISFCSYIAIQIFNTVSKR